MTRRLTLQIDLDLEDRDVQIWIHGLAQAMSKNPSLIEPVVSADVLDLQHVDNPARISFVDEMQKAQAQVEDIRGPFIGKTDKETGAEFVQHPELKGGE